MDNTILAATKLTIPLPVRMLVDRPHLLDRLDRTSYRVALVSAPAGFGKTALLASWADARRGAVAWLACDARDADPRRFWRGLLAAIGAGWPGVGDDAAVLLERDSGESPEMAISLANDLAATGVPMTIVIDDFHLAAPGPAVFADLMTALPATVRLVIGTRVDPSLPLGRLRVAGSLLELRSADLCFSAAETATVLHANRVTVEPGQVERLHDLTEGWPAGVQLAVLALRRDPNRTGFLDAFASTDRAVADFLVGEVLDRQPAELVEFLQATSVLEAFDGSLCEAVTGRDDAPALLARLVAANLFVVGLGGGWYRYHHLFGAFLQARLRALGQPRWRAAHDRAAQVYEARDDVANAIHHAMSSGNDDEAAAIIRRTLGRWITVVEPETTGAVVRQWLRQHGHTSIATDPVKVLEFLLPLVATTRADDARWWFAEIEAAHPDAAPGLRALLQTTWAEHHLFRGEADDALRCFHTTMDAVGGVPPDDGPLPTLPLGLARAHLQAGDVAAAAKMVDAVEDRRTGHPVIDGVRVPALQSWIAFVHGDLRQAEIRAGLAISAADEIDLVPSELGRIFAGVSRAGIHSERQDDAAADELFGQLRRDADKGRRPPLQCLVALQHAGHARLVGDEATASAELTLARLLLPTASRSVRSMFDGEAVRQAIRFRPSTAGDLMDALADGPDTTLLRVQLALVEDDTPAAAELLRRLPPPSTPRERVVRSVLTAVALRRRDLAAAHRELTEALHRVAQLEGFRRTVLAQAPGLPDLLRSLPRRRVLEPYVDELLQAAGSVVAPTRPAPVTSLVEPLSDRELTVLRYLCSRLTSQEIAAALFISQNTLKSHVKSVYRKLAVGSRHEAVEVGRELRIV